MLRMPVRHTHQQGFTVLEALLALTVAALVAAGAVVGYRGMAMGTWGVRIGAERSESLTALQRVAEELGNAVLVTEATPTAVTVVASTSSSAVAWNHTDPVTGGSGVLRRYAVRYYFQNGTLYRAVGTPPNWAAIPNPVGAVPNAPDPSQPPTPPSVPFPGPQPQPPSCQSPCNNLSGSYWARWKITYNGGSFGFFDGILGGNVSWNPATIYVPITDGNSATPPSKQYYPASNYPPGTFEGGCGGGETCTISHDGAIGRVAGNQIYWDWDYDNPSASTWNDPVLSAQYPGRVNVVGFGYVSYEGPGDRGYGWVVRGYIGVPVPYTSAVRQAWVPSLNRYVDEPEYNQMVQNWNNYQQAYQQYQQDLAVWQDRYNQWTSYYRQYGNWRIHTTLLHDISEAIGAMATQAAREATWAQMTDPPAVNLETARPVGSYESVTFTYFDRNGNPTTDPAAVARIVVKGRAGSRNASALAIIGKPGFAASAANPRRIPDPCTANPSLCPPPPPAGDPTGPEHDIARGGPPGGGDRTYAVDYNGTRGSVTFHGDGRVTVDLSPGAYERALAEAQRGTPGFGYAGSGANSAFSDSRAGGWFNDPNMGPIVDGMPTNDPFSDPGLNDTSVW